MTVLILAIVLYLGVLIYSSFSWGYVAYVFYGWFVTPYIHNLPQFTITMFVGFILFISVILPKSATFIKDEYEREDLKWIYLILGPWLTLFGGWVVHSLFF